MAEKKLTPKQKAFVSEYLKSGNATEAARKAGYKGSDNILAAIGSQNLRKLNVSRACEAAQAKRNERLQLEEDFELKKGIQLLRMCMEPHIVCDMKGNPVPNEDGKYVMAFDSKGANMALQTIAKLRGKFVQKVEVGFADNLSDDLEGIKE